MEKRIVLVTGSSRGIGKAIAQRFSDDSIVIYNCKKNKHLMGKTGIQADVSDFSQVKDMFNKILTDYGKIDVLINNAGVASSGLFHTQSAEEYDYIMRNNFGSVLNCCNLAVTDMLQRKKGAIVNISSIWGISGASCEVVYSASKGAVNTFTKALAKELAPSGIRVNAIAAGVIDTEMNDNLTPDEKEDLASQIPCMRFGKPHEIADLAYYLASDNASYITGQIITADGGLL